MAFSLIWLPEVLRDAGLKVAETDGWTGRGHGDMSALRGVMLHHTGTRAPGNMPTLALLTGGRPDLPGPLAQLGLGRDGTFYVIAAGRANHAGIGSWEEVTTGNAGFIGIQTENAGGPGDRWPDVQRDAARRGVAAILRRIGAEPGMCCGHREYAVPRGSRSDPRLDMAAFRDEVADVMRGAAVVRPQIPAVDSEGRPTLRRGTRSEGVRLIQSKVSAAEDGKFDARTEAAVRAFQRRADLVPDGIVGPLTWAALLAPQPKPTHRVQRNGQARPKPPGAGAANGATSPMG